MTFHSLITAFPWPWHSLGTAFPWPSTALSLPFHGLSLPFHGLSLPFHGFHCLSLAFHSLVTAFPWPFTALSLHFLGLSQPLSTASHCPYTAFHRSDRDRRGGESSSRVIDCFRSHANSNLLTTRLGRRSCLGLTGGAPGPANHCRGGVKSAAALFPSSC